MHFCSNAVMQSRIYTDAYMRPYKHVSIQLCSHAVMQPTNQSGFKLFMTMHSCSNASMRPCTHASIPVCILEPMHPCTDVFMKPCIHAPMHPFTHAPMQLCIHAPIPPCTMQSSTMQSCTHVAMQSHAPMQLSSILDLKNSLQKFFSRCVYISNIFILSKLYCTVSCTGVTVGIEPLEQ